MATEKTIKLAPVFQNFVSIAVSLINKNLRILCAKMFCSAEKLIRFQKVVCRGKIVYGSTLRDIFAQLSENKRYFSLKFHRNIRLFIFQSQND